ncbi:hypothetical protein BCR32DRAFT_249155 [Anaeromyces robustus]|uniref:Uncharacterized protein n=1 Tax=Anaeromyces robustus TaxID=1754192 RepID=A0A1Y1WR32_9FUNG|nr:hypothetical protein BCR32DRAFT_249155 [Anaeromyces robustus]|eukprot:ORX75942.1 hypothetical protein BCR32DRAFT_249155 [Anaeromyces robustus]
MELLKLNFESCEIKDLEELILYQIKSFKWDILNDNLDKILEDPNFIITQFANKYMDNSIFITLIKFCYIISLIHNNYSKFMIYTLVQCMPLKLYIKNNIIYLISRRNTYDRFDFEMEMFGSLIEIPILRQYLNIKYE